MGNGANTLENSFGKFSWAKKKLTDLELKYAQAARFYGWDHEVIMSMEAIVFDKYYRAINVLSCRERLANMTNADWPNMKKEDRRPMFKKISKDAYPSENKKSLKFTAESLRELINGDR